jgi:hypothetical protein
MEAELEPQECDTETDLLVREWLTLRVVDILALRLIDDEDVFTAASTTSTIDAVIHMSKTTGIATNSIDSSGCQKTVWIVGCVKTCCRVLPSTRHLRKVCKEGIKENKKQNAKSAQPTKTTPDTQTRNTQREIKPSQR